MQRHPTTACILFVCLLSTLAFGQHERLFSELNAYNPVPSPNGESVAFVEVGWGRGSIGGFGRSNLTPTIRLADKSGKRLDDTGVERFLGEWLADSSAVVCFRDHFFGLLSAAGSLLSSGPQPMAPPPKVGGYVPSERVAYLSLKNTYVWLETTPTRTLLQTPNGPIGKIDNPLPPSDLLIPSPDGGYLAIAGTMPGQGFHLWVYDIGNHTSSDLGDVTIHPGDDWDYIKPSWNPWFRDSSHLTYFSNGALFISSPDGRDRRKITHVNNAGLPVPSADGSHIAYVTFVPRPMNLRPDLHFWGDSTIWVIETAGGKAVPVTKTNPDTTLDLRWLDDSTLLFDRISDVPFYGHSRIWTVDLKQTQ
jgi:hypothetical protein